MSFMKVKTRIVVSQSKGNQAFYLDCYVSLSGVTASVEISQYETHEEPMKWKIRPTEAEMAGKNCHAYSI